MQCPTPIFDTKRWKIDGSVSLLLLLSMLLLTPIKCLYHHLSDFLVEQQPNTTNWTQECSGFDTGYILRS